MSVNEIQELFTAGKFETAEKSCLSIFSAGNPFPFQVITLYAKICISLRKKEQGLRNLQKLSEKYPEVAGIYSEMSRLQSSLNMRIEAIASAQKAIDMAPETADYHNDLGNVYRHMSDFNRAADCYRKTIKLAPELYMGHVNLGRCQLNLGHLQDARESFNVAIRAAADQQELVYGLVGTALAASEHYSEAIKLFKGGLSLNDENAEMHEALGLAYRKSDNFEQAIQCFKRAIELDPENSGYHNNYGLVLRDMDEWDTALEMSLKATELDPNNAEALGNLGNLYRRMEQPVRALELYERSLFLQPDLINIHCSRAKIHHFQKGDKPLSELARLLGRENISDDDKAKLQLALGKAMDNMGEYSAAFGLYSSANLYYGKTNLFDMENHRRYMVRCAKAFDKPVFAQRLSAREAAPVPIMVIGMSRSGKTQIEKILKTNPLVHGMDEDKEFVELFGQLTEAQGITIKYPECVDEIKPEILEKFGRDYLARLQTKNLDARYFVNTIPANFPFIGLMFKTLPGLRVINCERNPLDQALETFFKHYQEGNKYSYRMQHVGEFWLHYRSLMVHWANLYENHILNVTYEGLIADTDETVRQIFEFCNLDNSPPSGDLGLRPEFVGRWKNYKSELSLLISAFQNVKDIQ